MSNMIEWAKRELDYAGYTDKGPDDIDTWMRESVLKLLEVFSEEGHSGMSAPYAISLFEKLASWKPITPLTGEPEEWMEIDDVLWQNKRSPDVFKGEDGRAYWLDGRVFWEWYSSPDYDDGKPFKSYFTSRESRVFIEFPWTQPDKPEYVFVPTEQYPNEVLE